MKPSGVRIETIFDAEKTSEEESAALIMTPDEPGGVFLGGRGAYTASEKVDVSVSVEDGKRYIKTKSDKVKKDIVDTYVLQDERNGDRYSFLHGAMLGRYPVNSVLEVKGSVIKPGRK
jgi:hypothetical protein